VLQITFKDKYIYLSPIHYSNTYHFIVVLLLGGERNRRAASVVGDGDGELENTGGPLKKMDSFEGHEEAVRTLVAAVHQTRSHSTLARNKSASNL